MNLKNIFSMFRSLPIIIQVIVCIANMACTRESTVHSRSPSPPYITGDGFRAYCDFIFDETNQSIETSKVQKGDTIFVKTDMLKQFFSKYHEKIIHPYILITHNADHEVPLWGKPEYTDFTSYLNDDKIIIWLAQNVNKSHPKLISIPIGLENRYWAGKKLSIITRLKKQIFNKKYLLYLNFNISTYPKERGFVYQLFHGKSFCLTNSNLSLDQYYKEIMGSYFVLCPRGNGLDCHRIWETLYVGSIPVVKSSTMDPLFKDLPVLVVDDWKTINREFLQVKYRKINQDVWHLEKLTMQYWYDYIDKLKEEAKKSL